MASAADAYEEFDAFQPTVTHSGAEVRLSFDTSQIDGDGFATVIIQDVPTITVTQQQDEEFEEGSFGGDDDDGDDGNDTEEDSEDEGAEDGDLEHPSSSVADCGEFVDLDRITDKTNANVPLPYPIIHRHQLGGDFHDDDTSSEDDDDSENGSTQMESEPAISDEFDVSAHDDDDDDELQVTVERVSVTSRADNLVPSTPIKPTDDHSSEAVDALRQQILERFTPLFAGQQLPSTATTTHSASSATSSSSTLSFSSESFTTGFKSSTSTPLPVHSVPSDPSFQLLRQLLSTDMDASLARLRQHAADRMEKALRISRILDASENAYHEDDRGDEVIAMDDLLGLTPHDRGISSSLHQSNIDAHESANNFIDAPDGMSHDGDNALLETAAMIAAELSESEDDDDANIHTPVVSSFGNRHAMMMNPSRYQPEAVPSVAEEDVANNNDDDDDDDEFAFSNLSHADHADDHNHDGTDEDFKFSYLSSSTPPLMPSASSSSAISSRAHAYATAFNDSNDQFSDDDGADASDHARPQLDLSSHSPPLPSSSSHPSARAARNGIMFEQLESSLKRSTSTSSNLPSTTADATTSHPLAAPADASVTVSPSTSHVDHDDLPSIFTSSALSFLRFTPSQARRLHQQFQIEQAKYAQTIEHAQPPEIELHIIGQ